MRFWCAVIMLFVTTASMAQEVKLEELKARLKVYNGFKGFETKFNQVKFIKSMNVHLKSRGRLTVLKPNKVTWKITDPSPMTVKFDDKNLEMTSGQGKEATTQKVDVGQVPSAMKNMAMLSTWLRLDAEELSRDYRITKRSNSEFVFEPRTEGMFTSFDMVLSKKGHLKTLTIHEKSEDTLQIDFEIPKFRAAGTP